MNVFNQAQIIRSFLLGADNYSFRYILDIDETDIFVTTDKLVKKALKRGNLSALPTKRIEKLFEKIRFAESKEGQAFAIAVDKFMIDRQSQMDTLDGLNGEMVLDLIAQGFMPVEVADHLGISYRMLHHYLAQSSANGAMDVEEALLLCADQQAYRGIKALEAADPNSKMGVAKATETAKMRMNLAKALNPRRFTDRPDATLNQPIDPNKGAWLVLDVTTNLRSKEIRQINTLADDVDPTQAAPVNNNNLLQIGFDGQAHAPALDPSVIDDDNGFPSFGNG